MTLWKLPVVVIFRENSYFSPAFMKKQWTCCVIKKVVFKLCHLISLLIVYTPWFFAVGTNRYLPVRSSREIWDLGSSIRRTKKHERDAATKILLHSITASLMPHPLPHDRLRITSLLTTASTAAWCLMLLASSPEWQSRARERVLDIFHEEPLDFDMLRKFKTVYMLVLSLSSSKQRDQLSTDYTRAGPV